MNDNLISKELHLLMHIMNQAHDDFLFEPLDPPSFLMEDTAPYVTNSKMWREGRDGRNN
jgi:hypothetical protein